MTYLTNQPSEENPTCIKCGLYKKGCKHPFMEPDGPEGGKLLLIGEAPGKDEDDAGVPFVGRAGHLLRPVIEELGWSEEAVYTNVVRCRPPDNKIDKRMINYCKTFALQDIERYNPEVVLLLGGSPLHGIVGEVGITAWNGAVIEKDGRRMVPVYHPAYILRNNSALNDWLDAIAQALEGKKLTYGSFERLIPYTLGQVEYMASKLSESDYIAFDTEVKRLDAFAGDNSLLSVSFAIDGYTWSMPINHQGSWFPTDIDWKSGPKTKKVSEREKVIGLILDVLISHTGNVLAHNAKFDQMQIYALTGAWFDIGGDTMLLSHLLDSRQGIHGLKRLAGIHLGMYDYERPLLDYIKSNPRANPERGGSYDEVPLDILLPYGGLDAEAVWLLHPLLYGKLSDRQQILYDQLLLAASDVLSEMQCNGMTVDEFIANRYQHIYGRIRDGLMEEINADPKVRRMVKDIGKPFNPNSFEQKSTLFYRYYKMPNVAKTKTGNATTSSKVLKALEPKYSILKTIRYHSMLNKAIGTYLRPAATGAWLSGDGKARTNFNMHGTISGRLSASKPFNSQNIPVPEKEPGTILAVLPIKNVFTHDFIDDSHKWDFTFWKRYGGGVVMSADFSGVELRVFASAANCKKMLDIHKSGRDFHSMVAVLSTTHKPVHKITDEDISKISTPVRYRYKWTNWTLLYGGDAYTLSNLYDIPMDEAEQTVATYHDTFPEVKEYQDACIEFAEEHGYTESLFGRRAWLPWINDKGNPAESGHARREAVNIPIQSTASDTLLAALCIVGYRLRDAENIWRTRLINTVHDSIVLSVPRNEIYQVAELVKGSMENVATYAKEYMPDIDFSWLKCPLVADIEVGTHYGAMVDINEWTHVEKVLRGH